MTALMPHQVSAIEYLKTRKASMLAWQMGTGKTLVALGIIDHELRTYGRKAVVVCPAFLVYNWIADCKKFFPHLTTSILGGKKVVDVRADIIICSYNALSKAANLVKVRRVLVFDEAHYLCNSKSDRSKQAAQVCKEGMLFRLLLMTGTPMRNRINDLYHLLSLLDRVAPYGFNNQFRTKFKFADAFCLKQEIHLRGRSYPIVKYYGFQNQEHLKPWLNCWWMRLMLSDILNLPPISFHEFSTPDLEDAVARSLKVEFETHWNGISSAEHNYGENVGESTASAKKTSAISKVKYTAELALEFINAEEGPVLIFSDHVASTENIYRLLKAEGKRVEFITGDTSADRRTQFVNKFQAKALDALVATIGSMQAGFTLTAACISIFNDIAWDPASNEQAYARIYRISQEKHCHIYHVVGGDVDAYVQKTVRAKMKIIEEVNK